MMQNMPHHDEPQSPGTERVGHAIPQELTLRFRNVLKQQARITSDHPEFMDQAFHRTGAHINIGCV